MYTIGVSQITSIEKAFGLSSSETGWLLTVWEIGYAVVAVIATYFATRVHLPRTIGVATVICGISGLVFALPHFVAFSDNVLSGKGKTAANITLPKNNIRHSQLCVLDNPGFNSALPENETTLEENITVSDKAGDQKIASSKTLAFVLFNIGMFLQGAGKAPCYPYSSQYIDDNVDKQKTGFYLSMSPLSK